MSLSSQLCDLFMVMPQPHKGLFWLLSASDSRLDSLTEHALKERLEKPGAIFAFINAKLMLEELNIEPNPDMRLFCLNTTKKLLSKKRASPMEPPAITETHELLSWAHTTLAHALTKIGTYKNLVALECQVIPATIAMQRAGLPFAKEAWQEALSFYSEESKTLKARLEKLLVKDSGFALFGPEPLDLNSAPEVKKGLESLLGHKLSGTSQSALKTFSDNEAVKLLLRYREQARMLSTYGENFLVKIKNGRIHAHFEPLGSASGRFACLNPNLQALPNDPKFQACIKAEGNKKLLYFDYGAFELRILAALSGDPELLRIFNASQDIHSMVAEAVFKCRVSKNENVHLRNQAKVLNFGIVYGMGERALSKQLEISQTAAEEMLKSYFARFKRVQEFLISLEQQALQNGFVQTALGRRLYFLDQSQDKNAIRRLARNMPIQGTGADIAKLAFCRVYSALRDKPAQLVNMVHDELVIETQEENIAEISALINNEMSAAFSTILPAIEAEIGVNF